MVFLVKKKIKGEVYYYLAHNLRTAKGRWKSLRMYIGKELPSDSELESLKENFIKKYNIETKPKYRYLDPEKLAKLDYIIGEFKKKIKKYPKIALEKKERDFTIRFTYNTNAIEGNSISLIETAAMLEKKITPKGKSLREIYEILNTEKALNFLKEYKGDLSKRAILKLHKIMMTNIDDREAGRIRTYPVAIQGANWMPPNEKEVKKRFDDFLRWYAENKRKLHPIELAAIAHIKFIEVHPFGDGNGRVARLITNLILMRNGYPPMNIQTKDTIPYIKQLQYAQNTKRYEKLVDWFLHKLREEYVRFVAKE